MLEVFNNLFMAIAEQMGVALQNTAYSVNIKERLDFSCALFDRERLADRQRAAYAGASGLDGRERADHHPLARRRGRRMRGMKRGDVYVLNAPYNGGTHLPDVTVITPVFAEDERVERAAFLRRLARSSRRYRRHHARLDAARQHAASRRKAC